MPWQITSLTELANASQDVCTEWNEETEDARADRFWEISIVQSRGICAAFDRGIVDDLVNLVRCDPWSNVGRGDIKDFPSELCRITGGGFERGSHAGRSSTHR